MKFQTIKTTQILSGFVILAVALWFGFILIASSLQAEPARSGSLWLRLLVPLFIIFLIEAGLYWINKSMRIDESKLADSGRGPLATGAGIVAFYWRLRTILIALFILVILGALIYLSAPSLTSIDRIAPTRGFYVQIAVYAAYTLLGRRVVMKTLARGRGQLQRILPSYTIEGERVVIDLAIVGLGRSARRPYIVTLPFSELEEIRELSYLEAQSFLKYKIGPDITIAAQAAKDLYDYFRGNIERPNVYVFVQSVGKTLLLRGPHIFYLITVRKDDCSDLIQAFQEYKLTEGAK